MVLFQLHTAHSVAGQNGNEPPRRGVQIAGLVSLLLRAAVVLLSRWIGFTKGYDFAVPADLDLSFPG